MRRLPLTSAAIAEVFTHARDGSLGRAGTQRQLEHLIDARAEMPPSKAHIRRIERTRDGSPFVDRPRPYHVSAEVLQGREQLAHYKRMIAELGGSRTVEPTDDGTLYNAEARGLLEWVEPVRNEPHAYPTQSEIFAAEDAKLLAEKERLAQDYEKARAKVLTSYERFSRMSESVFEDCGW